METNYLSHTHCFDNKDSSPCGIDISKHTQCCLCDMKKEQWKKDEFEKYFLWVLSSGLHGRHLIKPLEDYLDKFYQDTWNSAIEACVGKIPENKNEYYSDRGFHEMNGFNKTVDLIRTLLEGLRK